MPNQRGARAKGSQRVIRVVLVEEHALVRAVLREMVEDHADIEIVGEAADIDQAIGLAQDDPPDVILVDTELPIATVVAGVQRLKRESPGSPVILLGHRRDDDELFEAIQAGAAAHIVDDARPAELVRTIRAVAEGKYLIDESVAARPPVARRVLEAFRDASLYGEVGDSELATKAFSPLSPRETEILESMARGMSNKDIAAALSIREQTVKNHVTNILRKLAVNDRTQAVLYALQKSWVSLLNEPPSRPH